MQEVYAANAEKGLIVLAINATAQDNLSNVQAFVAQNGLSFPILLDTENVVNHLYKIRSLPTTFFIAPDGKIREIVIGGPLARALLQIRVRDLIHGEKRP